jgi:selenocysteine lyase/cysteine desulfurase
MTTPRTISLRATRRGFLAQLGALGAAVALPRGLRADTAWRDPLPATVHLGGARSGLPRVPTAGADARFWRELREHFVIPRDEAFFNAGTLGASPRVVLDAMIEHLMHVERDLAHWDYDPAHEQFYTGYYPELALREKLGRVIHAAARDVALTANATMGMNLVAAGLDLGVGDEVVLAEDSHVGSRTAWELKDKRHGIYLRLVKPPADPDPDALVALFERATTPRTRVWAIEHLTSATAVRYPVEALCQRARARGILTVVDGAQTAGHLAVDVQAMGCDAYFASAHKWLLAPVGTGFLYVRRELQPRLWTTLASQHWDDQADTGFRLMQQGTASLSVLKGLDAALEFHLAVGSARVEERVVALADRLRTGLAELPRVSVASPIHPAMRTGTTVWTVEGLTPRQLQDALWARGRIRVRSQGTTGVRQCCHVYNGEAEVDRTLETARRIAAAARAARMG